MNKNTEELTPASHYDFDLPKDLIAQHPTQNREDARLLVVDRERNQIHHSHFRDIVDWLRRDDCLVLNETKVIPAKLIGYRTKTKGRWQGLYLEHDPHTGIIKVMCKTRGNIQPGETVQSDADIDAFVRSAVESAYHPSCACRMGEDDGAVVDSETRVRGIESLRVVDSSIFPTIPNGNLNSPTIMTAERAADLIKGKGMLAPDDAEVGLGKDWETLQRSSAT